MDERVAFFKLRAGEAATIKPAAAPLRAGAAPVRARAPSKKSEARNVVRLQQGAAALKTQPDWEEF
jgi:hypothetical protein